MQKTLKAIKSFLIQLHKNFKGMKEKVKKIWIPIAIIVIVVAIQSCNVTRVVTNESQFFQKGDTAVTIQTKTVETYNAEKK